jgi:hypothetical protein
MVDTLTNNGGTAEIDGSVGTVVANGGGVTSIRGIVRTVLGSGTVVRAKGSVAGGIPTN